MSLMATRQELLVPPLWEIEWRVVQIACEVMGFDRSRATPESRLLEDLGMDSLDLIDFMMRLEAEFLITLPKQACQGWFVNQPATLRRVAELVIAHWGTGKPDRGRWFRRAVPPAVVDSCPSTQLDGRLRPREWLDGQLYELLGLNREGYRQYRRRTDGMRCVLVPEAEVWIGSDDADTLPDQSPAHRVHINQFLIDAEPVSTTAFARFLNAVDPVPPAILRSWCLFDSGDRREQHFPLKKGWRSWRPIRGTERQPIVLVTWYGANAYALWANRRDWRCYQRDQTIRGILREKKVDAAPAPSAWMGSLLPSEANWEYAARGSDRRRFPWGDEPATVERCRVARHVNGSSYTADSLPAAGVSDRLGMSPFGLHHMAGNVWQWCRDWYAPDFYQRREAILPDAQNSLPTGIRSERGGSWVGPEELASSAYRRGRPPHVLGRCLGFRCVGLTEDLP